MYLQPCRKIVRRGRAKKALRAFLGTCGAAAVMTVALNCQKSDDANRSSERQASPPATRAPQTPSPSPVAVVVPTPPVALMGIPVVNRIEASPTPTAKPRATALAAAKATAKPAALRTPAKPRFD